MDNAASGRANLCDLPAKLYAGHRDPVLRRTFRCICILTGNVQNSTVQFSKLEHPSYLRDELMYDDSMCAGRKQLAATGLLLSFLFMALFSVAVGAAGAMQGQFARLWGSGDSGTRSYYTQYMAEQNLSNDYSAAYV